MCHETFESLRGARSGDQQVQVPDGFLAAAKAPGGADLLQARALRQVRGQLYCDAMTEVQVVSSGALLVLLDGAQHFLLELRSHARQTSQLLLAADALQVVNG